MKIAYNPKGATALTKVPEGYENDIIFDLEGLNIFAKGTKFNGAGTILVFKKHTSAEGGGYNGLVPVPSYTTTNIRYLREDGTWLNPNDYILLTNQDLNNYLIEGYWYYASGSNSVVNKPSGVDSFELYVGRNAMGWRYLRIINGPGSIWFRYYNSSTWSSWVRWYTDQNTDSKVLQASTTTANYRPIILGYQNSTDVSVLDNDTTSEVYTTTKIYAQPSTGTLFATKFQGALHWNYITNKPTLLTLLNITSLTNKDLNYAKYNFGGTAKGDDSTLLNVPTNYGVYLSLAYSDKNQAGLLYFDTVPGTTGTLYFRTRNAGDGNTVNSWKPWKRLACIGDNVDWSNITNKPSSFTPSSHTHPSSQITALTGYKKSTSNSAIATTDSLNTALGKLEYKGDLGVSAYNIVSAANDGDGTIENLNEILKVLQGISDTNTITGILANYVTLNTTLTITGAKTFTNIIKFSNNVGGIQGQMGDNDYWRIIGRSTASNAGYLEIATADDGSEPIYLRQYSGVFSTLKRTLTLLDGSGNSIFPGSITSSGNVTAQRFISTIASGTAPLTVASNTLVTNLNADLLDGSHKGFGIGGVPYTMKFPKYDTFGSSTSTYDYLHNILKWSAQNYTDEAMLYGVGEPNALGPLILHKYNGGAMSNGYPRNSTAILINYGGDVKVFGTRGGNFYANTVAYLSSNVASATKLLNKRYLWGQEFDGTADVSGNMTNVGNISMSGLILRPGINSIYVYGRANALIRNTTYTGYNPILSMKTTNGSWELGTYVDDIVHLVYITDTNYNANTNYDTYNIQFPKKTGTIALTSDISNHYWANIKVSTTSNTNTTPTFGNTTINGILRGVNYIEFSLGDSNRRLSLSKSGSIAMYAATGGWAWGLITYNNAASSALGYSVGTYGSGDTLTYHYYGGTYSSPHMCILPSGNVGIGITSPLYKLHVKDGYVASLGYVRSGSSNSYVLLGGGGHKAISDFMLKSEELTNNVTTITKTLTVTLAWMDTGIAGSNLDTGSYIVLLYHNGSSTTGIYHNYYTGVMSWYGGETNDTDTDEIILHRAGHHYRNTLYLRTFMQPKGSGDMKLLIAANTNLAEGTYTFKFKRII